MKNDPFCHDCGLRHSGHTLIDNHGHMCPTGMTFVPAGRPTLKAVLFSLGGVLRQV